MKIREEIKEEVKKNGKASGKYIYILRYGNYLLKNKKHKIIFKIIKMINRIWYVDVHGTDICLEAKLGKGIFFPHLNGIIIAGKAKIGKNATIFQQVTIGIKGTDDLDDSAAIIGDNVIIGAGAKIIRKS